MSDFTQTTPTTLAEPTVIFDWSHVDPQRPLGARTRVRLTCIPDTQVISDGGPGAIVLRRGINEIIVFKDAIPALRAQCRSAADDSAYAQAHETFQIKLEKFIRKESEGLETDAEREKVRSRCVATFSGSAEGEYRLATDRELRPFASSGVEILDEHLDPPVDMRKQSAERDQANVVATAVAASVSAALAPLVVALERALAGKAK